MKCIIKKQKKKNPVFVFQQTGSASKMLRKLTALIIFMITVFNAKTVRAQDVGLIPETPSFGIKTNILYDATATINLGIEQKLSQKFTLDLSVNYNPWTFKDEKKWKHLLVQPELRYWFCESFNGTFLGVHAHWAKYNFAALPFTDYTKDHRFQGWLIGGGVSIGHQWILSGRFSLEASLGIGYAYMDYDTYPCEKCGSKISENKKHYIGPTNASVSLIYILK